MEQMSLPRIALQFGAWASRGGKNLNPDDFITFMRKKFPNIDLGNVRRYINDYKNRHTPASGSPLKKKYDKPSNINPNRQQEIKEGLDTVYGNSDSNTSKEPKQPEKPTSSNSLKSRAGKNVGKVYTPKTPIKITPSTLIKGATKGAGIAAQALVPATTFYNTIRNWNAEGSNAATRAIDSLNTLATTGETALGMVTGHPFISTGVAIGQQNYGQGASQNIREGNINLSKSSVKALTPEEQAAYERYKATGIGGQLPSYNYNLAPDAETMQLAQNYNNYANGNIVHPSNYSNNPDISDLPPLPNTPASFGDFGGSNQPVQSAQNMGDNFNNMSNNQGFINTGAAAPIRYQTYVPVGDYRPTEFENQLSQQVLAPTGQITPQEMRGLLDNYYTQMRQDIAQNPYYGGGYIQTQGFTIDPYVARRQAERDALDAATGVPSRNFYNGYLNTQRAAYNAQIANQAGVPYEDYVTGMTERYKQQVLANQKQVESQLKVYAQQSTDMATKLKYLQEIQKSRLDAQRAIDVANATALGDIQEAVATGQYGLQREAMQGQTQRDVQQMKDIAEAERLQTQLNDPNATLKATGQFLGNASWFMQQPQMLANIVNALSPQQQMQMFGRQLNPQDVNDIFMVQQAVQQNPSWFAQLIQRYQPNIRGANEQ